ncbi:rhodanese-like domain-containing protein [Aquimarina agarilytica]|uniref:rhodanese-like domain-containing protein n=1 Tax=Aquimarina agarilytica TaxID=1087449 RepID=UPI000288193C|nr:rhodanese-like domain-containing protein [Aquimarina agarilytica]
MKNPSPLNALDFQTKTKQLNTIVLDVRHQVDFVSAHIPNSIFIGLDGLFEPWVQAFINTKDAILLITPLGRENETIEKLTNIGYTNIIGYLKDGFQTWKNENFKTTTIESIPATSLENIMNAKQITVFDIRKINEYNDGHIKNVIFSPLTSLNQNLTNFNLKNETAYIHCGGGYRSIIAISILKRNNIHNVIDIAGGMGAIRKTNIEII